MQPVLPPRPPPTEIESETETPSCALWCLSPVPLCASLAAPDCPICLCWLRFGARRRRTTVAGRARSSRAASHCSRLVVCTVGQQRARPQPPPLLMRLVSADSSSASALSVSRAQQREQTSNTNTVADSTHIPIRSCSRNPCTRRLLVFSGSARGSRSSHEHPR